jgi:hypothetical protein
MNRERSAAQADLDAEDPFAAGLRAGYGHGYDIGLAHGRAGHLDAAEDVPPTRLGGPDRAELIDRGYLPVDHTRPPALPVRLWTADDWAKADERDLPTTETGRADWRAALDAGHVPAPLAAALTEHEDAPIQARARIANAAHHAESRSADEISAAVADTARQLAALREHLGAGGRAAEAELAAGGSRERSDELARWYDEAFAPEDLERDDARHGAGR